LYTSGVLSVAIGLPGDFNHDGRVDAADYVFWRKSDGTQSGYNTWRTNFGRTITGAALAETARSANVPEPVSLTLVLFALGILTLTRRHHGAWAARESPMKHQTHFPANCSP